MTGGCFLVFSDYCKAALRMAALNQIPTTMLFSHDSIAVGEDGPTHQPVEQIIRHRAERVQARKPEQQRQTDDQQNGHPAMNDRTMHPKLTNAVILSSRE